MLPYDSDFFSESGLATGERVVFSNVSTYSVAWNTSFNGIPEAEIAWWNAGSQKWASQWFQKSPCELLDTKFGLRGLSKHRQVTASLIRRRRGSGLIGVHALAESAQQRVAGAHHLGVEPVHELSADLAVGRIVDSVRRLAGVGFQIEKFVCI